MPKPTDYDKTHLRNMAAIGTRIDRLFKKAAEEAAKIGVSIKATLPEDRIFSFDDYPQTQKQIERLLAALRESTEMTIADGVRREWRLSNAKNDAMVTDLFGERVNQMSDEQKHRYFTDNAEALEAFLQRKTKGLSLSDRVWKYTDAFKTEIEMGLDLGIRSGRDAAAMSRDLRDYLQHPDKLFRRVRDKHGLLRLSQAAKDFHPGQGVYRSSYKNARRLAATETNIAYRTNDYLRWQQMDFVVGIEIQLSNNHTILLQPGERTDDKSQQRADGSPKANAVRPLTDICDTLQGRYPKDFKFTGWHPHCRCRAITILKTEDEMAKDTQRILDGKQPTKDSVNTVRDVPDVFKQWVEKNTTRIENARNLPYFIKDNTRYVETALKKQGFFTTIMLGGEKIRLSSLIGESSLIETTDGKVYLHPAHGKGEAAENIAIARWRAETFGEEVILLPNPQGVKSPDSYNITRGVLEEYKRNKKSATTGAIETLIREGKKQADYLIIEPMKMPIGTLRDALNNRVKRCPTLKEIRIRIGNSEAVYTRGQIVNDNFKIKPEDFRNASVSRSQGVMPKGHVTDAKVADFFGINKKTVKEVATERHPEAIQKAWNERRIANIQQAINNRLLPKEVMDGLSALSQEQLNERLAFLQQRAKTHVERDPKEVQSLKEAWQKRVKEHERIKRNADRVLALAKKWSEVDYSALEKLIAEGKLTGLDAETRKVMDALKAMRAEEKTLQDLIPDVHGWHKMFTLDELKEAHGSIQSTLDFWKTMYGADLATDSNLAKLQSELEQKIKFVENPGAFKKGAVAKKYWQVTQDSYIKLLDQVEIRIEIVKLTPEYENLLMFKTTSKDFKLYMANAKKMLDDGDPVGAKMWLNSANSKKAYLEAQRGGRKGNLSSDKYYSDFTEAQAKEAKRLEKQIFDALGKIDWYDDDARRQLSNLCDQYAQHIETVSEGLFPMQKSIYTAAERKEFDKQMRKYLKEKGINPNYIWGGEIGGVWDSLSWARDNMAKALGTVTADELSLCTRFSSGMTFYNAYNLRNSSEYFREIWREKLKKLAGSNGKVKLKDIRDQYRIIEEYTQALNGLQDKMMRYRGITFRAVHSKGGKELLDTFNDCWTNGKAWKNNAAASTSKDIMVSIDNFDDRGNYDLIMIIRNKTGCNIQPISEYGYEKEVMIIKDREYRLLGKPKKIGGKYFVELEEI